jgi:hypothetical protein
MADYYPLISRAVAALEKNNGENRRAIYERARAALLAQLRGVTPPLNESDITRERLALEESIRKVEAESARKFVETARQSAASRLRSAELRRRDEAIAPRPRPAAAPAPAPAEARQRAEVEPSSLPPRRFVSQPAPLPPEPEPVAAPEVARKSWAPSAPAAFVGAHEAAPSFEQPLPPEPEAESPPPLPPPPEPPPPAAKRWSLFDFVRGKEARKAAAEPAEADEAFAPAQPDTHEPPPLAPTSIPDLDRVPRPYDRPQFDRSEPAMLEARTPQEHMFEPAPPEEPRRHEDFSQQMLEPSYDDDAHPALSPEGREPPPPQEDEYEYEPQDEEVRPRPSYRDLTRGLAIAGLVISIGGLLLWQWPNMVSLYRSFRAPPVEVTREAPPPAATTRPKITDRIEPGTQQAPTAPTPAPGGQPAAAPAAQKVVLYEEDPGDPNGKRFVGSAIWRTEMVAPAPGQPPELAIRADVEVPERKLAMTWSLRRNTDKSLPATHTVEINFKLPADFPSGGISNVPGILMKQAEQTRGVPLAGLAVKVTPGFYLIGLSNLDADKDRNLQLLKERGWFDIPVVYNNNRRAILAMEKGTPGERAFADAFKAWKQ